MCGQVPAPAATISFSQLKIGAIVAAAPPLLERTRDRAQPAGLHLRFSLENLPADGNVHGTGAGQNVPVAGLGDSTVVACSPSAQPKPTTASTLLWDEVEWPDLRKAPPIRLKAPRGAPRPLIVRAVLWDSELPEDLNPLAAGETRLASSDGVAASEGAKKMVLRAASAAIGDVSLAFSFMVQGGVLP